MYSNQFAGMYTELYILKGKTGREDQEPEGQSHPGGSPHLQRIRLIINLIVIAIIISIIYDMYMYIKFLSITMLNN